MTEDLPDLTPLRLLLRLPQQEAAPEMARLAGNPQITAITLEIPYPPNDRRPGTGSAKPIESGTEDQTGFYDHHLDTW